jgi:predicted TIM-barrel fold metal-dependent hydrolase
MNRWVQHTNETGEFMSKLLIISSDCHAGALPAMYDEYMPKAFHEAANQWWLQYTREMIARSGTFFDQEAVEDFAEQTDGEGMLNYQDASVVKAQQASDETLMAMLSDESSPFSARRGEFDAAVRLQELEADGIAGEVIFPQMAPFGAGLMQYRYPVTLQQSLEGNRAYNRWLADFCNTHPGRHAGVAIITVDDIDTTVQDIRDARKAGLFGGILLPTSTGNNPYYHHPRYEPLWAVCAELDMPIHTHAGWSPDYGDVPAATAMYLSEVDMWAKRPFAALVWSGAFERYSNLKLVMTEVGSEWIVDALRWMEYKASNPLFAHFKKGLSMSPSEYFQRNCYLGASFLSPGEAQARHRIGIDRIMWGSDYPHMEGTWPNTLASLRATFGSIPEDEIRSMMGATAAKVFNFDVDKLNSVAQSIGPEISAIIGPVKQAV